jgi:hypothetical protein
VKILNLKKPFDNIDDKVDREIEKFDCDFKKEIGISQQLDEKFNAMFRFEDP